MKIDVKKILLELQDLPKYSSQISLQGVKDIDDCFYGTGRLTNLENHKESDFIVPNFPHMEYTNHILKELKMFRSRVMKLDAKACYTYHKDPTKRLHIPLITNENCFFVIEDEIVRLPADGNYYLIDTTKKHTFVNSSLESRIHIVGCVEEIFN